jgi:hypothetical protein
MAEGRPPAVMRANRTSRISLLFGILDVASRRGRATMATVALPGGAAMIRSAQRAALAFAFTALFGGAAAAQSSDPLHLECAGPFGPEGSETGLEQVFGAANVAAETIDGPEGSTLDATLLFPDDPTRRLIVLWQDETARSRPAAIIVRDDSEWIGPGGLRLGDSIEDVETVNGAPFDVLGFGWDYGGAASFPAGTLADIPGACVLSLSFDLDWNRDYGPEFDPIMGDQQLQSDNPQLRAAAPTVSEIIVGYPFDEGQ